MEPRVTFTVASKLISFLFDTGTTFSAKPAYSGKPRSAMGIDSLISTPWIIEPLPCTNQDIPFPHSFLILPKCPIPILGRELLSKFKAFITIWSTPSDLACLLLLNPTSSSLAPLPSSSINPKVWDTDKPISCLSPCSNSYPSQRPPLNSPINHDTPSPKNISKG